MSMIDKTKSQYCMKYCPHGGACFLNPGHNGLHSSKPFNDCEWTDEECLTKQEADLLVMAMSRFSNLELEVTQFIIDRN